VKEARAGFTAATTVDEVDGVPTDADSVKFCAIVADTLDAGGAEPVEALVATTSAADWVRILPPTTGPASLAEDPTPMGLYPERSVVLVAKLAGGLKGDVLLKPEAAAAAQLEGGGPDGEVAAAARLGTLAFMVDEDGDPTTGNAELPKLGGLFPGFVFAPVEPGMVDRVPPLLPFGPRGALVVTGTNCSKRRRSCIWANMARSSASVIPRFSYDPSGYLDIMDDAVIAAVIVVDNDDDGGGDGSAVSLSAVALDPIADST